VNRETELQSLPRRTALRKRRVRYEDR
jgi:hypothetical protein